MWPDLAGLALGERILHILFKVANSTEGKEVREQENSGMG